MTGTERKVFQKYYPPDFDPSKIPRAKGQRNRQFVQRVMAPFNMQCNTCHEYIYKGKKFNMRRETAEGEFYHGLKIFRFYFRCPNCLAEITFKTDLENCDYQEEHGATRLFEAFKLYQQEEKAKETKEEEEKKDPMKMLEKRTKMSRTEMEAIGKLEELQEMNKRAEFFDANSYMEQIKKSEAEIYRRQEEKDEEFVRKLFGRTDDGKVIKRILDNDEDSDESNAAFLKSNIKKIKKEPAEDVTPSTSSIYQISDDKYLTKQRYKLLDEKEKTKESRQKQLLSKVIVTKSMRERVENFNQTEIEPDDLLKIIKKEPDKEDKECDEKIIENKDLERCIKNEDIPSGSNALQSLAAYGSDSGSE